MGSIDRRLNRLESASRRGRFSTTEGARQEVLRRMTEEELERYAEALGREGGFSDGDAPILERVRELWGEVA